MALAPLFLALLLQGFGGGVDAGPKVTIEGAIAKRTGDQIEGVVTAHVKEGWHINSAKPLDEFAIPTVLGEIKRHFRDRTWAIRVPRRLQELRLEITAANDALTHSLGRPPTVAGAASENGTAARTASTPVTGCSFAPPDDGRDGGANWTIFVPAGGVIETSAGSTEPNEISVTFSSSTGLESPFAVIAMRSGTPFDAAHAN